MGNIVVTYLLMFFVTLAYTLLFGESETLWSILICGVCIWAGNQLCPPKKTDEYKAPLYKKISAVILVVSIAVVGYNVIQVWKLDHVSEEKTSSSKSKEIVEYYNDTDSYSSSTSPEMQEALSFLLPDSYDVSLFKNNYPMVWGYIQKNAEYPNTYLSTYMNIWGKLQKYHGDGIPFDTLNTYEQTLVNFPEIGPNIYFANNKTKTYHSSKDCYALLASNIVVVKKTENLKEYDPCSKCVGDTQHINAVRKMYGYK
jgi:hypothetical protein